MLWAYVDDSNIHDRLTGKAKTIGHGGGIALFESWRALEDAWKKELEKEDISAFHMTDFENYKKRFKGWSSERHDRLLNALISIIRDNVAAFVGYSAPATPGKKFAETYKASLGRMLHYCGQTALKLGEPKINLVFAHHPQVKSGGIGWFLEKASGMFPEIASFKGASPSDCCALQAADLLAYEFVRWRRAPDLAGARHSIQSLMIEPTGPFQVFHA